MANTKYLGFNKPDVNGNNNQWGTILNSALDEVDKRVAVGGAGFTTINTTTWLRLGSQVPLDGRPIQFYGNTDRAIVLPNQATATGNEVIPLGTIIEAHALQWGGTSRFECEGWASGGGPSFSWNDGVNEVSNQQRLFIRRAGWVRLMYIEHPGLWRVMGNGFRSDEGS